MGQWEDSVPDAGVQPTARTYGHVLTGMGSAEDIMVKGQWLSKFAFPGVWFAGRRMTI